MLGSVEAKPVFPKGGERRCHPLLGVQGRSWIPMVCWGWGGPREGGAGSGISRSRALEV